MLFNSLEFFLFLPIIFVLYWWVLKNNNKSQNFLILIASYIFYGWWDWRFLFLIAFSTIVDYLCGLSIGNSQKKFSKKLYLGISIVANLGLLVFFKYFNFFIESWVDAWGAIGVDMHTSTLNLILPVGISFYTFQTLSYSIDIYRGSFKPTKDFIAFSAFVSFFPQLVAGPIERASHLLPQFFQKRKLSMDTLVEGGRLIIWGLFKKVAIADMIAPFVNDIFNNFNELSSSALIVGAILFAIQIYCDFSGYSDIAIGTAKLFNFDLMTNFKFPYFSRNIAEFWRRWHISLSTWFRDYLYIPLGGSRTSKSKSIRNIFIIFIVSGFWHGANWTFIFWGVLHALYFLPIYLTNNNRKHTSTKLNGSTIYDLIKELFFIVVNFMLVSFAWIFFRSDSLASSFEYIARIFASHGTNSNNIPTLAILSLISFIIYEWICRHDNKKIFNHKYRVLNYILISIAVWMILINASNGKQEFIYFQF